MKLDFSGGPWKLRNGEVVNNLKKMDYVSSGIQYFSTEDNTNLVWDDQGNGHSGNESRYEYNKDRKLHWKVDSEYDIMENLNNWKYSRKNE